MRELVEKGTVKFHVASVKALHGDNRKLGSVTLSGADKKENKKEEKAEKKAKKKAKKEKKEEKKEEKKTDMK